MVELVIRPILSDIAHTLRNHSFIHLFIHSFIHLFIHSFIHLICK